MATSSRVALAAILMVVLAALVLLADAKTGFESDDLMIARPAGRSLLAKIDCGGACDVRCKLSSRPRLCMRACGSCCKRCNCVPSGTYGNYEECPCYAKITTRGNRRKCP